LLLYFLWGVLPPKEYTPEQKAYYTILRHGSQTPTQLAFKIGISDDKKRLEIVASLVDEGLIELVSGQGERANNPHYASYRACA